MVRITYVMGREIGLSRKRALLAPAHVAVARIYQGVVVAVLGPVQRVEAAAHRAFFFGNLLGLDLHGRVRWRAPVMDSEGRPQHYLDFLPATRALWVSTAWGWLLRVDPQTGSVLRTWRLPGQRPRPWGSRHDRDSGVRTPSLYYDAAS